MPWLDEPLPAIFGEYAHAHTRSWASVVASYDGFVFVTPEYNHSYPAVLKNALDYLYAEWNDKAAGFVSLGGSGGLLGRGDLEGEPQQHEELNAMLDELMAWASALRSVRAVAA